MTRPPSSLCLPAVFLAGLISGTLRESQFSGGVYSLSTRLAPLARINGPNATFPAFHYLTPSLCSLSADRQVCLKRITTTSWAAFAIDTQGKIAYTSTYKKGVLIHIHLIITGRVIDAQEALRIGLANEVVPKGTSLERSFELARYICTLPQPAIRTDKEAAVRGFGLPLTASVNASRRSTAGQIFSKDYDSPDLSDPWLILHYGSVN